MFLAEIGEVHVESAAKCKHVLPRSRLGQLSLYLSARNTPRNLKRSFVLKRIVALSAVTRSNAFILENVRLSSEARA